MSKAALLEFMAHLGSLGDGARFEIGDSYDVVRGWSVYIRAGDKGLICGPGEARKFADICERMAARPEWTDMRDWALDNAKTLREAARAVTIKNRDHVVPAGYAEMMPTEGSA